MATASTSAMAWAMDWPMDWAMATATPPGALAVRYCDRSRALAWVWAGATARKCRWMGRWMACSWSMPSPVIRSIRMHLPYVWISSISPTHKSRAISALAFNTKSKWLKSDWVSLKWNCFWVNQAQWGAVRADGQRAGGQRTYLSA